MHSFPGRSLLLVSLTSVAAFADADVKHESTRIGAWIDAGQVVQGRYSETEKAEMQVVTRSKVALSQTAIVNQRLTLAGAVGGLFFYSLPPVANSPHTRLTKFSAVLEEASAHYKAGDLEQPWMDAKFGLFFQKYNPDAKNLGEYLFRSGAYPGYLQTGGWYIINSAGYFLQGVRTSFNLLDGALRPEALLYMERDWDPTYDLTPAFLLTYKAGQGAFEAGAGVAFHHLIAAKPSAATPNKPENGWWKSPTTGRDTLVSSRQKNGLDSMPKLAGNYTFQGTKVMLRASFNLQSILNLDLLNPEDLKIYAEMAVLGVKDYPVFYTNVAKRVPMMMGFNFPTFKLVDKASFELEYYNSDFPNSLEQPYEYESPLPGGIGGLEQRQAWVDSLGTQRKLRDKVKWSFWLRKDITTGLGLYLQVASDHFRPMDYNLKPNFTPVTRNWNDWYYMVRLNFGI